MRAYTALHSLRAQMVQKKSVNMFVLYEVVDKYSVCETEWLVSGLMLRLKVWKPGRIFLLRLSVLEQDTEQSTCSLTGGRCGKERLR